MTIFGSPRNFSIKRGRAFDVTITSEDSNGAALDLTGYSAEATIRKWPEDGPILGVFEVTIPDPSTGDVWLHLSAETTAAIASNGHYDVKLTTPSGGPIDLIEGQILMKGRVTT